jgi:hypothetical protein
LVRQSIPRPVSRIPTARELYILDRPVSAEDERNFFASLRLRNRTFKTTHLRRLDDLNRFVLSLLPKVTPLKIMDVAVSSGVTTVEWSEALLAAGIAHEIIAGDVLLKAFLISLGRYIHVLVDNTGYPLQFEFWGRPVPNPVVRRRDRVYRPLIAYVHGRLARHFASLKDACEAQSGREAVRRGRLVCHQLNLVSPALAKATHVELVEDDIQHNGGLRGRFHVVRAANILNRKYFSDEVMRAMVGNLQARLQAGGLLVVCRTNDEGANAATVFHLRETGGLEVAGRLGGGSEVESLVLSLSSLR